MRRAAAHEISQFGQGRPHVDEAKAGDAAPHIVIHDEGAQAGHQLRQGVAIPKSRPGDQDEQEPGFEEQRNEQQAPEQDLASGLNF